MLDPWSQHTCGPASATRALVASVGPPQRHPKALVQASAESQDRADARDAAFHGHVVGKRRVEKVVRVPGSVY